MPDEKGVYRQAVLVEDCNPFRNLHEAINRVDISNKPEYYADMTILGGRAVYERKDLKF